MEIRDIKGFEGKYMVSDDGRIYSLLDFAHRKRFKEKKQCLNKYGYKYVSLYANGVRTYMTVHRAVATAFLINQNDYPQVNHKDGNKQNNNVSNLEWCTASENVQHAYDIGLNIPHESPWKGCKHKDHPKAKPCILKKDGVVKQFSSSIEASEFLGVSKGAVAMAISRNNLCKGWKADWIKS